MGTSTLDRPRSWVPGAGSGGDWRIVVLNDNRNTFDHVAATLASVIPGVTVDHGYQIADRIHTSGQAMVWAGPREPAELYWEELCTAGLSMAPLERV